MPPWSARRLTAGERALAQEVFGATLDPEPIRILAVPGSRAFVPGRAFRRCWIVWPAKGARTDFAEAPVGAQAVLVHELVHAWQAQQGVILPFAKLKAGDGAAAYAYVAEGACDWNALNIEQQAMVVEHAFRLSRGEAAPGEEGFYRAAWPHGRWGGSQADQTANQT